MLRTILLALALLPAQRAYPQAGVPGTLNQIQNDPAQSEFEQDYAKLRKTVKDLERPKPKAEKKKLRPSSGH